MYVCLSVGNPYNEAELNKTQKTDMKDNDKKIFRPKCECEGLTPRRQQFVFWRRIFFFKQMAVARSIFTLGGTVQLFWAAFDMPMTGVPLKVALGYKK